MNKQIIAAEQRIDVLINNAGFGLYGPVEDIPMDEARYQFDVNIFGLASLTKLVLPQMRRQNYGKVINTSSMGGKIYTPLGAWYHATKHALEGWSDCLRLEVKQFGIHVVLIEPGLIATEFGSVVGTGLPRERIEKSAYRNLIDPYVAMMSDPKMMDRGTDAKVLAGVMADAVNARRPKTRYVKGMMAKPLMFLRRFLGDRGFDRFIAKAFS